MDDLPSIFSVPANHVHNLNIRIRGYPDPNDLRPRMRPRMMMRAELESMWSTCKRLRVGAVAFDVAGDIIVSAYNGAPRGQTHCKDINVDDGRCQYCVHAETNLVNHAAKLGVSIAGANVATLYRPCVGCANNLLQSQVAAIYYRYDYDTDGMKQYVEDILRNTGSYMVKLDPTEPEQSYSEFLQSWSSQWSGISLPTSPVAVSGDFVGPTT